MPQDQRRVIGEVSAQVVCGKRHAVDALIDREVPDGFTVFAAADQPDIEALAVRVDAKAAAVFIGSALAARAGFKKAGIGSELKLARTGVHTVSFPWLRQPHMETDRRQTKHAKNPHEKSPQKITFRGHMLPCVTGIPTDSKSRLPKERLSSCPAGNAHIKLESVLRWHTVRSCEKSFLILTRFSCNRKLRLFFSCGWDIMKV